MPFNPKRLQQARKRRGFTRRRLALETRIAERTLAYNESGDHPPTDEHLEVLSHALDFPVAFFFQDDPEPLPAPSVSFRAMSRMTAGKRDRVLAAAELALDLSAWLDDRFDLPTSDMPDLRYATDPESAAVMLRSYWTLGDRPITNMVHLLEKKGIRVFSLAEDCETVDAFSFWRGDRPYIFLNTMKSGERGRFDAAHELGHLVMHGHGGPGGRKAESEADAFAACFLMPPSSVVANQPALKSLPGLIRAKREWGVSVLALARRMHETNLLTAWRYRQVCIEAQQLGIRKHEPDPIPRESSQVLHKVLTILWSQKMTPGRIAADLGWPKNELDALTFQIVPTTEGEREKLTDQGSTLSID